MTIGNYDLSKPTHSSNAGGRKFSVKGQIIHASNFAAWMQLLNSGVGRKATIVDVQMNGHGWVWPRAFVCSTLWSG